MEELAALRKIVPRDSYLRFFALCAALTTSVLYFIIFDSSPSLNGEDLAFSNKWAAENPVERILWIVDRSIAQINGWNARLGEQLSIFWLNVPPQLFSLFAVAVFILLGYLVSEISDSDQLAKSKLFSTSLSLIFIVALWPSMDVFFWKTTEAGYLQPILVYLLLIRLYARDATTFTYRKTRGFEILLSVLMFIAGVSFENTPVVLGGALLTFQVLALPIREIFSLRNLIPYFSLIFGWTLLATAPSTRYRVSFFQENLNIDGYSWSYLIDNRLVDVLTKFIGSSWVLILLFIVAILVIWMAKLNTKLIAASLVAIFLNVVTLLPAPYTEPRTFLLSWCLMISVIIQGLKALNNKLLQTSLVGVFGLVSICTFIFMVPEYQHFGRQIAERDAEVLRLSATSACESGIGISRIETSLPLRFLNNREDWIFTSLDQVSSHYGCAVIERQLVE